ILVAEDDTILGDGLVRSLQQSHYAVDWARHGLEADHMLAVQEYDLVILDLGLPRMDGLEVLRRLRKRGSLIPVLILSARDAVTSRVAGLDLGADDYLTKPFDLLELEARVRVLMRRGASGAGTEILHGALRYDTVGRRVFVDDRAIDLSARELGVLEILL